MFGFAFMAPTAPALILNSIIHISGGGVATSFAIAFIAMLLSALSYRKLARAFPFKGSIYTYAKKGIHRYAGFAAGWSAILFYLMAPIVSLILGSELAAYLLPGIPRVGWVIIFALVTAGINLASTKAIAIFSTVMVCLSGAIVTIYILVCAITVSRAQGSLFSAQPFGSADGGGTDFSMMMGGAGLACMAFLGFDAIAVFSGDASQPKKQIGRAMLISVIVFGIVFFLQAYFSILASPGIVNLGDADNAILMAGIKIGGPPMVTLYLVAMLLSTIAVAIVAQAAAIRMLRALGETGMLPKAIFAQKHMKFSARYINPIIVFAVLIISTLVLPRASQLFGVMRYGGLLCFVLVNITVIWHFYFRRKGETIDRGNRRIGNIVSGLVLPAFGFFVCLYLWLGVGGTAFSFGTIWMCAGALILALTILIKAKRCRIFSRVSASPALFAPKKAQPSRPDSVLDVKFQFFERKIKRPFVLLKGKIGDMLPFSPMTGLLPAANQKESDEHTDPLAQETQETASKTNAKAIVQLTEGAQKVVLPEDQNSKKPTRKPAKKRRPQSSGRPAELRREATLKVDERSATQPANPDQVPVKEPDDSGQDQDHGAKSGMRSGPGSVKKNDVKQSTEPKPDEMHRAAQPTELKSNETPKVMSAQPAELKSNETPKVMSAQPAELKSNGTPKVMQAQPAKLKSNETPKVMQAEPAESNESAEPGKKQSAALASPKRSAQQKSSPRKRLASDKPKTGNGNSSKPSVERRRNPRSKKAPPGQIELPLTDKTSPENPPSAQSNENNDAGKKE